MAGRERVSKRERETERRQVEREREREGYFIIHTRHNKPGTLG